MLIRHGTTTYRYTTDQHQRSAARYMYRNVRRSQKRHARLYPFGPNTIEARDAAAHMLLALAFGAQVTP